MLDGTETVVLLRPETPILPVHIYTFYLTIFCHFVISYSPIPIPIQLTFMPKHSWSQNIEWKLMHLIANTHSKEKTKESSVSEETQVLGGENNNENSLRQKWKMMEKLIYISYIRRVGGVWNMVYMLWSLEY